MKRSWNYFIFHTYLKIHTLKLLSSLSTTLELLLQHVHYCKGYYFITSFDQLIIFTGLHSLKDGNIIATS